MAAKNDQHRIAGEPKIASKPLSCSFGIDSQAVLGMLVNQKVDQVKK